MFDPALPRTFRDSLEAEIPLENHNFALYWSLPDLIAAAGREVTETYIDFFTSTIRNRNTRAAYARACCQFFEWCAAHGLALLSQLAAKMRYFSRGIAREGASIKEEAFQSACSADQVSSRQDNSV